MMGTRLEFGGNGGAGKGLVDVTAVCEGCILLKPNAQQPPAKDDVPAAIAQVLQKWMLSNPVRVREMLPVILRGSMVALFVWFDRAGP